MEEFSRFKDIIIMSYYVYAIRHYSFLYDTLTKDSLSGGEYIQKYARLDSVNDPLEGKLELGFCWPGLCYMHVTNVFVSSSSPAIFNQTVTP